MTLDRTPEYLSLAAACRSADDLTPFMVMSDWLEDRLGPDDPEVVLLRRQVVLPAEVPRPASGLTQNWFGADETAVAWLARLGVAEVPATEARKYQWGVTVCSVRLRSDPMFGWYWAYRLWKFVDAGTDGVLTLRSFERIDADGLRVSCQRSDRRRLYWNAAFVLPCLSYRRLAVAWKVAETFRRHRPSATVRQAASRPADSNRSAYLSLVNQALQVGEPGFFSRRVLDDGVRLLAGSVPAEVPAVHLCPAGLAAIASWARNELSNADRARLFGGPDEE